MHSPDFISFLFLTFTLYSSHQAFVQADSSLSLIPASPFSIALQTLQNQINYTFDHIGLLRRAMTHSSYSEENNKALSILGESLIETSVALKLVNKNMDISTKDLSNGIAEVSKVETSCAVDGMRLGLQNIIRVSSNTNSSTPSVVCGAFRAIFGAIAVDTGSSDSAGRVFLRVHGGIGRAVAIGNLEGKPLLYDLPHLGGHASSHEYSFRRPHRVVGGHEYSFRRPHRVVGGHAYSFRRPHRVVEGHAFES